MPRGRPKGSKNKVSAVARQVGYSIGVGTQYNFPIVRDGNVSGRVANLSVGAESFYQALADAIQWAWDYSNNQGAAFWPLVKYKSLGGMTKTLAKRANRGYVFVENKDYGCWLNASTLEAA